MADVNRKVLDVAAKINRLIPLKLGDKVIHKVTGLCGTVSAVESYERTDTQMVSVDLLNGKSIRGMRREELGLHTPGAEQVRAQTPAAPAGKYDLEAQYCTRALKGPIIGDSILDELC